MVEVVTVACKLPNGLILDGYTMETIHEMTLAGGRDIKVARHNGMRHVLNGVATAPHRDRRDDHGNPVQMSFGYALTHNVPKDLWDNWLSFNVRSSLVINRMVFAAPKLPDVTAMARENERRRSGQEPVDPAGDPRAPKQRIPQSVGALGELETAVAGS